MSRSYKRTPCNTEKSRHRYRKKIRRWYNKRLRRYTDVPNFSGYKKTYESWDINDFSLMRFLRPLLLDWNNQQWWMDDYSSWKEVYADWVTVWKTK